MFEFVFSLRFLLILFGLALVVGIYVFGNAKAKRNKRFRFDARQARFEPANRRVKALSADEVVEPTFDDVPEVEPIGTAPVTEEVIELPVVTRDGGDTEPDPPVSKPSRKATSQLELTFDHDGTDVNASEPEAIISLYVRPPSGHEFAGAAIVQAMNSVGLRYGDMNIFHHYGAGELQTELPLFSVANMMEPGHFDLHNIEGFATPGLAMFLRLPAQLDGAVAFELFLNTAQRLAEALSGDLYGDPKHLLDSAFIDQMRQQAIPFASIA